ncbi:MAG: hypothetical protein VST68_03915, partial [Nitrospirota bacterium]|nr:hypothetical protein [Nitrospirota bacterium]
MLLHKMAHPRFIAGMIMMTLTATSPATAFGQERNITQTSIVSHVVFNKSFKEQVALGRGDTNILNSSWSLINHEMLADEFPQDWRAIPDQAKQTASIQKIVVGGVNPEMGLESFDPDWAKAPPFEIPMKPAGKVLEGLIDNFEVPPATPESEGTDPDSVPNNIPTNLVDNLEYYLANYFKPATNQQTRRTRWGQQLFKIIKCTRCHTPGLVIE